MTLLLYTTASIATTSSSSYRCCSNNNNNNNHHYRDHCRRCHNRCRCQRAKPGVRTSTTTTSVPSLVVRTTLILLLLLFITTNYYYHNNQSLVFVNGMRIVVQRVKSASVTVDNKIVSEIGPGIVALVGIHENDTEEDIQYCCQRLIGCKLWDNDDGTAAWRSSVKQKQYEVLCVSQFTLYGTLTKRQWKPDYKLAMKTVPAQRMYNQFLQMVHTEYYIDRSKKNSPLPPPYDPTEPNNKIKDGIFGAMMDVALINDGPVTLIIESIPTESKTNETNTTTTISTIPVSIDTNHNDLNDAT